MIRSREFEPKDIFSGLSRLLAVDISNSDMAISAGQELESLVAQAVSMGQGEHVISSFTAEQIAELRNLHSLYEVEVDDIFMNDVLSGAAANLDQYHFQNTYNRLAFMEGVIIGADNKKPIMHIGTGWPGTAIGLYRQFGAPVTCVETDPDVAEKSRDALGRLGLIGKERLQVVNADGTELNPEGFGAVIVSAMVSNEDKKKVLRNMRELSFDISDPLIILRNPTDRIREMFYQTIDPGILPQSHEGRALVDTRSLITPVDPLVSTVYRILPFARVHAGLTEGSTSLARARLRRVA